MKECRHEWKPVVDRPLEKKCSKCGTYAMQAVIIPHQRAINIGVTNVQTKVSVECIAENIKQHMDKKVNLMY